MNRIFILTGPVNSGKSTFLDQLAVALQDERIRLAGLIAKKHWEGERDVTYFIRDIQEGGSLPLSSGTDTEGWLKTGSFYFNPDAVAFGNELLKNAAKELNDIVIIDELGPFELENKMWAEAITSLLVKTDLPMIWVVRTSLLDEIIKKWDITDPVIIDITKTSVRQAVKQILSKLAASH